MLCSRWLRSCVLAAVSLGSAAFDVNRTPPAESLVRAAAFDVQSLDGDWSFHEGHTDAPATLPQAGWGIMAVPSNWYRRGIERATVVWFARRVELPAVGARFAVEFEGVDYAAQVFWDGVAVGQHRGYFAPFRVELPRGKERDHVLAVRVESPLETPDAWSLRKTLIKGVLGHHDTRPGGAWSTAGQDAGTGGIWGHVRLRSAHAAFVEEPRVDTVSASEAAASLRVEVAHDGPGSARSRYEIYDPDGQRVAGGALRRGHGGGGADVKLEHPRRWWPRELGRSELYTIHVTVDAGAGRVDRSAARFAIRTVRRDGIGRLLVNEQPLFLRGTNYIATQYFADFPHATLLRDFALMEAAHINAVRVHAHVTLPAFYDLADECGMLVLQDFPLQWGYDESPAFAAEAARQAREMVALLHNHPSIVFWSGINEAPYSSEWMKWKYPDYAPDQNRVLERAVYAALAEDRSRPSEGNGSPAHHVWAGWYDGSYRGFARPQSHSWITEYGAQAVPSVSTLATFLRPEQMWPIEKNLSVWEYHNFQLKELRDIAKVPLGSSIEGLIQNTQRYQARLLQFAAENLRRQKWQPVSAVFQFMLVEHWPSVNWGIVDYLRQPKLGYSALARAYQAVLPVAVAKDKGRTLELFVINDRAHPSLGCTLLVRTVPEGRLPLVLPLDLPSDDVVALRSPISRPGAAEALVLELLDGDGTLLSRNAYEAGYFEP